VGLTREGLRAFLEERFGLDTAGVDDDTPLFSTGILDSFSLVDLILHVESETGLRIRPSDVRLEHLDSIASVLEFARMRLEERDAP